jgi:predicted Zn-dependent protease
MCAQHAAQYGRACRHGGKNFADARKLQPLLSANPTNAWYLDPGDRYRFRAEQNTEAINRLKNAAKFVPTRCCSLTWQTPYLSSGQAAAEAAILNRYTFNWKDDVNGWDLLAQAEATLGHRDEELAARAEGWR